MKGQPFRRRLGYAVHGLRLAVGREASLRTQLFAAAALLALLLATRPAPLWWAVMALAVGLVLVAELINTALEAVVDRLHPERHPEIGAQIISQMRFAPEVAPIISGHHEYWDGSGYPRGLRGDQIPIGARIITIADAYDAMTTDRPYRAALSIEEAVRRLQAARGTQFDPELLDIFLELIARGAISPERARAQGGLEGVL